MKKNIILISLFSLLMCYQNIQAANLTVGFLGQFALTGANTNSSKIFPSQFKDFDTGFIFSLGLKKYITSQLSSSILIDLGYYQDTYNFKYNIQNERYTENYQFNSFLAGGHLRFNLGFLSIGAGGGIKIPIRTTYKKTDSYLSRESYTFKFSDLNDIFERSVIPYLRVSLDFLIFKSLLVGLYASYDFPIKFKQNGYYKDIIENNKKQMNSVDIGIQFGYFADFNTSRN